MVTGYAQRNSGLAFSLVVNYADSWADKPIEKLSPTNP
jgi:hypothetical protein